MAFRVVVLVPGISELSDQEESLSDYEKQRMENIQENQKMLEVLGKVLSIWPANELVYNVLLLD